MKLVKSKPIKILGVQVAQDELGRYRLNDLHQALGGEKRHSPRDGLRISRLKSS